MINHQIVLVRREIWEHRAIFVVPAVISVLLILMTVTGQIQVTMHDKIVNLTIVFLSNVTDQERALIFDIVLGLMGIIFAMAMWTVTVFYCLDALYAERKDKSILFWRSLPITDAETIISKLLIALLVIPLITVAVVFVTDIVVLLVLSIWVAIQGGDANHLIWNSVSLIDSWVAISFFVFALPLWLSPFVGWFLFVSGFVKKMPLMLAFLPIIILPMLEAMTSKTTVFWDAFFVRTVTPPLFDGGEIIEMLHDGEFRRAAESVDLMGAINFGTFLSSPGLWTGLIVCGLLTTAAIYVRRYRDEN